MPSKETATGNLSFWKSEEDIRPMLKRHRFICYAEVMLNFAQKISMEATAAVRNKICFFL
jgi:hypothetical protein